MSYINSIRSDILYRRDVQLAGEDVFQKAYEIAATHGSFSSGQLAVAEVLWKDGEDETQQEQLSLTFWGDRQEAIHEQGDDLWLQVGSVALVHRIGHVSQTVATITREGVVDSKGAPLNLAQIRGLGEDMQAYKNLLEDA